MVTTSTAESEDEEDEKPLATKKAKVKVNKTSSHQDETPVTPKKQVSPQQPKGLVDSLSKYFTPGDKRTSRTALAAASPVKLVDLKSPEKVGSVKRKRSSASAALVSSSEDDSAAAKAVAAKKSKRNKSLDSHTTTTVQSDSEPHSSKDGPAAASAPASERKRHTSSGQQLRSLYDGLSHLYTDCDSRLRHIPSHNYAPEKRRKTDIDENDGAASQQEERPASAAAASQKSPARISSPHRMSDSELREREAQLTSGHEQGTTVAGGVSKDGVPIISGSKATLNDIRITSSGKTQNTELSSKSCSLFAI